MDGVDKPVLGSRPIESQSQQSLLGASDPESKVACGPSSQCHCGRCPSPPPNKLPPFHVRPVTVHPKPRPQPQTQNKDSNYHNNVNNEEDNSAQAAVKSNNPILLNPSQLNSEEKQFCRVRGIGIAGIGWFSSGNIGGLGRVVVTATNSVNPKQEKQLRGFDVLRALQKAATARKPRQRKRRFNRTQSTKAMAEIEKEQRIDYSNAKLYALS